MRYVLTSKESWASYDTVPRLKREGVAGFGTNIIPRYLVPTADRDMYDCTCVLWFGLKSLTLADAKKSVIAFALSGPPNLTIS